MSDKFYKEIKIIRFCLDCKAVYRPSRYKYRANINYCWNCKSKHKSKIWKKLTPEQKDVLKEGMRKYWASYITIRREKNRARALASYHKHKHKHKKRRHRSTKKTLPSPSRPLALLLLPQQ